MNAKHNENRTGGNMNRFERTSTVSDIHGNTYTKTVVDRNAARTEARLLQSKRDNLRSEYVRTMANAVVLTPTEQAETGYYGRVYGVDGNLGTTDESGWTWLTFPEWKEVIKSTRQMFADEDAVLARQQDEAKAAAFGRR